MPYDECRLCNNDPLFEEEQIVDMLRKMSIEEYKEHFPQDYKGKSVIKNPEPIQQNQINEDNQSVIKMEEDSWGPTPNKINEFWTWPEQKEDDNESVSSWIIKLYPDNENDIPRRPKSHRRWRENSARPSYQKRSTYGSKKGYKNYNVKTCNVGTQTPPQWNINENPWNTADIASIVEMHTIAWNIGMSISKQYNAMRPDDPRKYGLSERYTNPNLLKKRY